MKVQAGSQILDRVETGLADLLSSEIGSKSILGDCIEKKVFGSSFTV
jgi:hypothetical protein